ncbi:hypothetical protein K456DRAFT_52480 [Colletotrichum gloeosporioides 23]|nr:hypothetical protein K456DRAFT_52480 [Colletotrichum gloeosporioides 23]
MSETLRNRSAIDITRWLCGIPDIPTPGLSSAPATDFPSIAHQKRKPLWDLEIPQHERGRPAKRLRRTPIQALLPLESLLDPSMNADSHETHELGTVSHDAFPATPSPKKRRLDLNATLRAPVLLSDSAS